MTLVDTHCHLQDVKFVDDREDTIARTLDALAWCVVIGDDLASSRAGLDVTRDGIYAAVGVHPYYPNEIDDAGLAALRELAAHDRVVAIGEIGLDYHMGGEDVPSQHNAFTRQLELAAELKLPVVIHSRDAAEDTLAILADHHAALPGVVMHCFSGDAAFAGRCAAMDFYISFAGNVSFPKAEQLREAARVVPKDRLLVETDAPYLAPQPRRGKRCEPAFVQYTLEAVATARGDDPAALAAQTTENAQRFFGISPDADRLVN
jgi:TatD DNase family protein